MRGAYVRRQASLTLACVSPSLLKIGALKLDVRLVSLRCNLALHRAASAPLPGADLNKSGGLITGKLQCNNNNNNNNQKYMQKRNTAV
jgi:hypothetical protein